MAEVWLPSEPPPVCAVQEPQLREIEGAAHGCASPALSDPEPGGAAAEAAPPVSQWLEPG